MSCCLNSDQRLYGIIESGNKTTLAHPQLSLSRFTREKRTSSDEKEDIPAEQQGKKMHIPDFHGSTRMNKTCFLMGHFFNLLMSLSLNTHIFLSLRTPMRRLDSVPRDPSVQSPAWRSHVRGALHQSMVSDPPTLLRGTYFPRTFTPRVLPAACGITKLGEGLRHRGVAGRPRWFDGDFTFSARTQSVAVKSEKEESMPFSCFREKAGVFDLVSSPV